MNTEAEIKTEFSFSELSPRAKQRAREWWSKQESNDFDGSDIIADAETVAGILGIDIKSNTRTVAAGRNSKARSYQEPAIYYSGFCSQGDGACFEGRYSYAPDACQKIRKHAGQDEELHRIADELKLLNEPARMTFCGGAITLDGQTWIVGEGPSPALAAVITHSGNYCHSRSMSIDVTNDETGEEASDEKAKALSELLSAFADWIYGQLEAEYEYRTSDAAADDALTDGDYLFDEDGDVA